MCTQPRTMNGVTFACRACNECLSTRKNDWVSRAMAEKATSAETYSITLTYNSTTEHNHDGATVFRYRDVRLLLKRLRRACHYAYGVQEAIRFISAGEIGSDKKRVHWHLLLFADCDLLALGDWSSFSNGRQIIKNSEKITTGKKPADVKRLNWSLWPHGLVTVQEPDQHGIEYALKYVLKDQFSTTKSIGTMRQSKSEGHAAGHFRMSKSPPIAGRFLDNKLDRLRKRGAVLPQAAISVPGASGYWTPTRTMRERLLTGLRSINQQRLADTGLDAPQWESLTASVVDQQKDWEGLVYGTEAEEHDIDFDEFQREIQLRAKEHAEASENRSTRKRCGGYGPCGPCQSGKTDSEFQALVAAYATAADAAGGADKLERQHRSSNLPSPFCLFRCEARTRKAFTKFT